MSTNIFSFLKYFFQQLNGVKTRIHYNIPKELAKEVGKHYIHLKKIGFTNGQSNRRVIVSLVYFICKKYNHSLSITEMESEYSKKEILRTLKKIKKL